jgi:hypothetical protein
MLILILQLMLGENAQGLYECILEKEEGKFFRARYWWSAEATVFLTISKKIFIYI